jgi:beta-lactamase regulating signal transducer with metallopeptidase domain
MVWNVGLGAALAVPMVLLFLPSSWSIGSSSIFAREIAAATGDSRPSVGSLVDAARAEAPILSKTGSRLEPQASAREAGSFWVRCAVACWALGAVFEMSRFAAGHFLLYRRSRNLKGAPDRGWSSAAQEAARKMRVSGPVRLLQDCEASTPAVWGLRNSVVVLPNVPGFTFERKLVVLLHEYAHIKRGDSKALWLLHLAASIYWFHPVVRLSLSEARKACELACDDMVLGAGVGPCDYATHLLEISQDLSARRNTNAAFCFVGVRTLESRLTAILDPSASRMAPKRWVTAALGLAIAAALIPISATRPFAVGGPFSATAGDPDESGPLKVRVAGLAAPRAPGPGSPVSSPGPGPADPESGASTSAISAPAQPFPRIATEVRGSVAKDAPSIVTQAESNGQGGGSAADTSHAPELALESPARSLGAGGAHASPVEVGPESRPSNHAILAQGTRVWLNYLELLSSKTAAVGDPVEFALVNDLRVGGVVVARSGSRVEGRVTKASKARPPGISGAISIRLGGLQVGSATIVLRGQEDLAHDSTIRLGRPHHLRWPFGLFRAGDDVAAGPESVVAAFIDEDVPLSSLGW